MIIILFLLTIVALLLAGEWAMAVGILIGVLFAMSLSVLSILAG